MEGTSVQGRRYYRLQKAFADAVDKGVQPASFSKDMQALFPGVPEVYVDALQELYTQVLKNIYANSKVEFDEYCLGEGVSERLAALEEACERQGLSEEAGTSGATATGSVLPRDAARTARVAAIGAECDELQRALEQAEEEGRQLEAELQAKQGGVADVAAAMEAATAALDKASELYRPWTSGEVTEQLQATLA